MPKVPILMPQLGESIAEATIIRLNIAVGDSVVADQEVIEVETNKATMGVTALCAGEVVDIVAEEGISYAVGTVLGVLEVTQEELDRTGEKSMDEMAASGNTDSTQQSLADCWVESVFPLAAISSIDFSPVRSSSSFVTSSTPSTVPTA